MKVRVSAAYATSGLAIEMNEVEIEIDGVLYKLSESDERLRIEGPSGRGQLLDVTPVSGVNAISVGVSDQRPNSSA